MIYDPTHPTVYFDIGEAIAAIGILLAFITLSNPTRGFRWSLGWFRLRTAYILFFIGIAFVLFAAVLPALPFNVTGFARLPIFWEVSAGLAFAIGSLGLILCGSWPVRYTKRNGKRFFKLCYSVIGRGDDVELGALAEEIKASANTIVEICGEYDQNVAQETKGADQKHKISMPAYWACKLMDLWSDRRFCNVIVTRCPRTALTYIRAIQKMHLYNSAGYSFVLQLIAEAFRDPDSILHREEKYSGLGHFLFFSETVFGNYGFVKSNFRPLQAAGSKHDNSKNLEKYIECLIRAVKAYLDSGYYHDDTAAIWCGVDILSQSAWYFVIRIGEGPRPANLEDDPFWALSRINNGFKDIVKLVKEYEDKLPEYPFDDNNVANERDRSIYDIIAHGIYEFYDRLTRADGHDWDIRSVAIDLWMAIYSPSAGPESKTVIEIQKRLEVRLWAQVEKNLEAKSFCYPMITQLLVNLIGLHEHPRASDGEKRVSERLRNILKEKFRTAAQLDDKRARELLPEDYDYDKQKNVIVERDRWGGDPSVFACD